MFVVVVDDDDDDDDDNDAHTTTRIRTHAQTLKALVRFSASEMELFESGLVTFGKCFDVIQREKVRVCCSVSSSSSCFFFFFHTYTHTHASEQLPWRTTREVIEYYYYWKKTEAHDAFVRRGLGFKGVFR